MDGRGSPLFTILREGLLGVRSLQGALRHARGLPRLLSDDPHGILRRERPRCEFPHKRGRAEILRPFWDVGGNEEAHKRSSRGEGLHIAAQTLMARAPLSPRSLLPASSPLLPCVLPTMLDSPHAQHFPGCTGCGCLWAQIWMQEGPAHAGHSIIIFISPTLDAKKENQNCSAPYPCPPPSQVDFSRKS